MLEFGVEQVGVELGDARDLEWRVSQARERLAEGRNGVGRVGRCSPVLVQVEA